jgi:hypothetical protein
VLNRSRDLARSVFPTLFTQFTHLNKFKHWNYFFNLDFSLHLMEVFFVVVTLGLSLTAAEIFDKI